MQGLFSARCWQRKSWDPGQQHSTGFVQWPEIGEEGAETLKSTSFTGVREVVLSVVGGWRWRGGPGKYEEGNFMVFPGRREAGNCRIKGRDKGLVRIWSSGMADLPLSHYETQLWPEETQQEAQSHTCWCQSCCLCLVAGPGSLLPRAPPQLDRPLPSLVLHRYFCLRCRAPQGSRGTVTCLEWIF